MALDFRILHRTPAGLILGVQYGCAGALQLPGAHPKVMREGHRTPKKPSDF